jgi:solute carrier family 35 (UDP-sugar transporter), member A1/2/3
MALGDLFSIKYGALALLVLQNTFLVIFMRYSRTIEGPLYASSTAVFMMEVWPLCDCIKRSQVTKFVSCNLVVLFECGSFSSYAKQLHEELTFIEILKVSIPSLVYTVQNNLLYFALTHLDAATYQVCYQVCLPLDLVENSTL